MPAYPADNTPVQIGTLKAYVDTKFKGNKRVKTYSYSAYLSIMFRAFGVEYNKYRPNGNMDFRLFVALLKNFNPINIKGLSNTIETLIKRTSKQTQTDIKKLEKAMIDFIEEELAPNLDRSDVNLIGFSICGEQVYSSLFCYYYLNKHYPDKRLLYCFGGTMTSSSITIDLLKKLRIKALVVKGEGELKLEKIISSCLHDNRLTLDKLYEKDHNPKDGIYYLPLTDIKEFSNNGAGIQLASIDPLPSPDYDEYFIKLRNFCSNEDVFNYLSSRTVLLLEGSRGCCWGKCDFCNLNRFWHGSRNKKHDTIYNSIVLLTKKYKSLRISFTDNSSDQWIYLLCKKLISQNIHLIIGPASIRPVHNEFYYTALSLAGCKSLTLGLESLSEKLLERMNKGAPLILALQSLKYAKELGINIGADIIIKHPKSELADIKTTKKNLSNIIHLERPGLVEFVLEESSPIFKELNQKELNSVFIKKQDIIPKSILPLYLGEFKLPETPHRRKINKEWDKLLPWYNKLESNGRYLNVQRISKNTILIRDGREDNIKEYKYENECEKVYTSCHKAKTVNELVSELKIKKEKIKQILKEFTEKRLIAKANNKYLSIATRPSDELINNYFKHEGTFSLKRQ